MSKEQQGEDVFQNLRDGFSSFGKKVSEFVDDVMGSEAMNRGVSIKTDVFQDKQEYVLQMELPGVAKSEVDIKVYEGTLIVRGKKDAPEGADTFAYEKNERRFGDFRRDFQLPQNTEMDNIKAKFENGVLTIRFPRKATEPLPDDAKDIDIQ